MGMILGKNSKIHVGETTVVLSLNELSFTDAKESVKVDVFNSSDKQIVGTGTRDVAGSCGGFFDKTDTTGQDVLYDAYLNDTTVSGFRITIDTDVYYHATGVGENDGVRIVSWNPGSTAGSNPVTLSFNFEVGGAWTYEKP